MTTGTKSAVAPATNKRNDSPPVSPGPARVKAVEMIHSCADGTTQ